MYVAQVYLPNQNRYVYSTCMLCCIDPYDLHYYWLVSCSSPAGSHGVHLEMAADNIRALKFYHKLGFKVLDFEVDMATGEGLPPDKVLILGRQL